MIRSSFKSEKLVIVQVLTATSFGLKPITYQCAVHCTDIPCITFYVVKPRIVFNFTLLSCFFLESTKTSSMVEKNLNKYFKTSFTFFLGGGGLQISDLK